MQWKHVVILVCGRSMQVWRFPSWQYNLQMHVQPHSIWSLLPIVGQISWDGPIGTLLQCLEPQVHAMPSPTESPYVQAGEPRPA